MNDYHVHSHYCRHGEGQIYEYVEQAIAAGCSEIGFAEHIPIPDLNDDYGRMVIDNFPAYLQDVRKAQHTYPQITIRLGLEADYLPQHMDYIRTFISQYPFDYVIGSVHFIGDWDFSNPQYVAKFEEYGVEAAWRAYYQLIKKAAETRLYDVIGHFDMPKKFGHRPSSILSQDAREALLAIKEFDLALDVNTSGRRRAVNEIYPAPGILQQAFKLGIPVVLGSDAHAPAEVAFQFPETLRLLHQIGYRQTCVFENRKPHFMALEI
jgi:histidinol-phosphatase (PHP family)